MTITTTRVRCAICNRVTLKPAAIYNGNPVGPTCARRRGLIAPAARTTTKTDRKRTDKADQHRSVAQRDTTTLDLFAPGGAG
jgi:hypothetical protein